MMKAHDPAEHVAALDRLLLLAALLHDDAERHLSAMGLTESRTRVVWVLHARGPSTQRDLAEALHVSARTVTGLVDGLEATGFATRQAHPTDRRAVHITLTPRGLAAAEALAASREEFADLLFADMPATRFAGLVTGLDDVLARFTQLGVGPAEGDNP
jgi:DNA-binding MarR family transcriptional regulator